MGLYTPSEKSPAITQHLDATTKLLWGISRTEAIENDKCVWSLDKPFPTIHIIPTSDSTAIAEYRISALCETCQKEMFT